VKNLNNLSRHLARLLDVFFIIAHVNFAYESFCSLVSSIMHVSPLIYRRNIFSKTVRFYRHTRLPKSKKSQNIWGNRLLLHFLTIFIE